MNTKIKFGDMLLALVASALLACSLLSGAGCALLSSGSTTEQKLADVRSLSYAAASLGTSEALLQNPDWRPQFLSAYGQLDQLVTQKIVTGDLLRKILASLPVKELKSERARIAIESATVLYDATVGDKINIESQIYVLAAATGIRDGFKVALNQ